MTGISPQQWAALGEHVQAEARRLETEMRRPPADWPRPRVTYAWDDDGGWTVTAGPNHARASTWAQAMRLANDLARQRPTEDQ